MDMKKQTEAPRRTTAAARKNRDYESPVAKRIMKVALSEFAAHGYDNVTMRGLARKAGLETPSIYYQFRNKRELYLKCWEQVVAEGNEGPWKALNEDGTAEFKIYRFLVEVASVTLQSPHMSKFTMRQLLERDTEGLRFINDAVMHDMFELLLATLQKATGKPATMREPIAAYALNLMLCQFAALGGRVERDLRDVIASPESLARYVMKVVFPDLAAKLRAPGRASKTPNENVQPAIRFAQQPIKAPK
jgi:AcrR family transcriptional regulator